MNDDYDFIFETKETATEALDNMKEIALTYGYASLSNYEDLVGVSSKYTDNKIGWTDRMLERVNIYRVRSGWIVDFPEPIPIDCSAKSDNEKQKVQTSSLYGYFAKPTNKPPYEPLYITINTSDIEDPDEVIHKAFKFAYDIKDRIVNISIM